MQLASTSVSLCLACSASLPPRTEDTKVFHTTCCFKPICSTCIAANPRLTRYNPCLLCLAGVRAVNSGSSSGIGRDVVARTNVDGSMRDEDVFVLEDEDEDDSDVETDKGTIPQSPKTVGPDSQGQAARCEAAGSKPSSTSPQAHPFPEDGRSMSTEYFIRPDDTLLGISFKLGIDGRLLCRLNNLPASTLRTTPHLLHTRSFLVIPPSGRTPLPLTPAERALDEERRARLAVECAQTRFQAMTKETDRDIAKAYVAFASLPADESMASVAKECEKEQGLRKRKVYVPEAGLGESSLEGRAVDQYFDDDEWEARERAEGRKVTIPSFPYPSRAADKSPAEEQKSWWRWRS